MSKTSGISEQVLSLPKGGGAIQGLGDTFKPDLHTGTGSYSIPLDIPNGINDIAPKLALSYHTGAGNSAFGMGFDLNLLTISRSTNKKLPTYRDEGDTFILNGAGELVAKGDGKYRLRVSNNAWQIERDGNGFKLQDGEGKIYKLGVTDQAQLYVNENGFKKVYSWCLEEIEDVFGNKVIFSYMRDGNQLYLKQVDYSIYTLRFEYEERPDPIINGRAGFLINTRQRCSRIELLVNTLSQPLTRFWELKYMQSVGGGHSLLHKVKLTGVGEDGHTESTPILKLDYTKFEPRKLERFTGEMLPENMSDGRCELIDWDGNGLPDLMEIKEGRVVVWRNLGEKWAGPQFLDDLPAPLTLDESGIAFADMEGNGTADLIMIDRALNGYYPHLQGGGFGRPVYWKHSPNITLTDPNVRLIDLNGDGITDLLVTGENFISAYYRDQKTGWSERPKTLPRSLVPPVSFSDPHTHLADLNGDGLQDLVRLDGKGITYWPYLGNCRWAEPIFLDNPPDLPLRFDPKRMFFNDIDGDGCADLVYVDFDKVIYWLNQGGVRLSEAHEILYTPPVTSMDQIRLADMKGTGTTGVLWTNRNLVSHNSDYYYLDFAGSSKPYLLNKIDNGMGLVTKIEYGMSTHEAIRDHNNGSPWETFLPFPVPVVSVTSITDEATKRQSLAKFRYHNGHFDGISREFAGFGMVEVEEVGDESIPTMLTYNWHHLGLDPKDLTHPLTDLERQRLKTLRGKLLKTEVYGADGSPDQDKPILRTTNRWDYRIVEVIDGVEILLSYLVESQTFHLERKEKAFKKLIMRNLSHDSQGNITEQEERWVDLLHPDLSSSLFTSIEYVTDPANRFVRRPARIVQRDTEGKILSTVISYYDNLPEGQIGEQGLLTCQENLVLTDAIISQVYGEDIPDFAQLGYQRRSGEDGWWVNQVKYTRVDDVNGIFGTTTNARGYTTEFFFDSNKIQPKRIVDALGNSTEAVFNYRANKLESLTDANGVTMSNRYDSLGRLERTIKPGDSDSLPTMRFAYKTDQMPIVIETEERIQNGQEKVRVRQQFLDGFGEVIEERFIGNQSEIVEKSQTYTARGQLKEQFLPYSLNGSDSNPDELPKRKFYYDALGRLLRVINPDGSVQNQQIEIGVAFLNDEEDNFNSAHCDTPTRLMYDSRGQIIEVAVNDSGRWIPMRYKYDQKGNLVASENALNQKTTFVYDLLGRRLYTETPESGKVVFVFDANGNQIEKRDANDGVLCYEYDELDRLISTCSPKTGEVLNEYTFNDSAKPAPVELGTGNFTKGRIVKIKHQGGEEYYDYDCLGRTTKKVLCLFELPDQEFRLDFSYTADGQLSTVTYPAKSPGLERLQVRYNYDQRGLLSSIPNYIRHIDYNLSGQRTRVEYANGVTTTYDYDRESFRLKELITHDGSNSVLQEYRYEYDLVGNLLKVNSPDLMIATSYLYDDLYRLKEATTQAGNNWRYEYDDLGNLVFKSDVGRYQYDENGLINSVGDDLFTHTALGQMKDTPWGEYAYDLNGYLRSVTRNSGQMECVYDHTGKRVSMEVKAAESSERLFTPDELIFIKDGALFARILDCGKQVAQVRIGGSGVSFLHGDHLGSTGIVTGPEGQVVQKIYYDPFGSILENYVFDQENETFVLYTGEVWDAWSELLYLNARYYNPKLGRFITPDAIISEIFQPLSWNRYSYVRNNPLCFVDPTGHFWEEVGDWFKDNWKSFVISVVTITAVVALTVVTFGAGALIGVGIAMAVGGTIGGIAAHQAGGDILSGILVGMAAGGAAAFGGLGIQAGVGALLGNGLLATIASGAFSGAVSGAAMGFASGYAGGQGDAGRIFDRMWKGALTGAIVGAAFGATSYALKDLKVDFHKPSASETREMLKSASKKAGEEIIKQAESGNLTAGSAASSFGKNLGSELFSNMVRFGSESGHTIFTPLVTQSLHFGLTGAASGALVLDWADDIWDYLVNNDLAKISFGGEF
ncbi:MAG: hypothetical protein KAX49_00245 [Halanaerobiales bacterium]|nr:hypothetical protein [Halanaerobiales bacterium]